MERHRFEGQFRLFDNNDGITGVAYDDTARNTTCSLLCLDLHRIPMERWVRIYEQSKLAPSAEGPFVITTVRTMKDLDMDIFEEYGVWTWVGDDDATIILMETDMSEKEDEIIVAWINNLVE